MILDISDREIKIRTCQFEDMIERYDAFVKSEKKEPTRVYVLGGGDDFVSLARFKDMRRRYEDWVKENGQKPLFVWVKHPTVNVEGCITTGYYEVDRQDTGYTCGPSSLKMALSALGIQASEAEIARVAGTTTAGTTHDGMIRALRHYGVYGVFKDFYRVGWDRIASHIKNGGEIVLHIMTDKLQADCNGNIVWRGAYGHYIYLTAVCPEKKQGIVADPTKGIRCHTFGQLEAAMAAVKWAPSVLFIAKDPGMLPKLTDAEPASDEVVDQMTDEDYVRLIDELAEYRSPRDKEEMWIFKSIRQYGSMFSCNVRANVIKNWPEAIILDEYPERVLLRPDLVIGTVEYYKELREGE